MVYGSRIALVVFGMLAVAQGRSLLDADGGFAMMGGLNTAQPSDADVQEAAKFATDMYNSMSNSIETFEKGRIVTARKQVVAGMKYVFDMELVGSQNTVFIGFEVFKGLSGDMELSKSDTYFTLRPQATHYIEQPEQNLIGGYHAQEVSNPEVRSAALEFTRTMEENVDKNSVVVLCKAQTQVVNGINYKLTVGLGDCEEPNTRSGVVYKPFNGDFKVSRREPHNP